jgi:hypothetical protein
MGDRVDQEVAMSQQDKEIETEATWQAHNIRWAQIMKVPDPCGHQQGYQRIVAIYIKYLMTGINFRNKDFLRLATVQGYASSINSLFKLRDMKSPINVADPNNVSGILINNLVKEEDIVRQRSPLDSAIFAKLLHRLNVSCSLDSEQHTLFDLVVLGRYIGPRVSKYAQTMDKNVDYHVYPSRKKVIKAFTANNFCFFDKNSQTITELSDNSNRVDRVRITWRIQKNCQNNQTVTLLSDKANTAICPVLATLCLVLRARCLLQPDSMPVGCYLKKDALAYITGSSIAILFQAAAKAVRPTISKEEEQQYSAHLLRVWACVLLNEAGKLPNYIKKCLRWMGDSFRMYLHNTRIIQNQHREALRASSVEVMDLVSTLPDDILRLSIMSGRTAGNEDDMGEYHDDMD